MKIGEGGYGLIVDSTGMIINHSNPEFVGKPSTDIAWLSDVLGDLENINTMLLQLHL